MDIDSLTIKEKVKILQSKLVRDKIGRLGFGPPYSNDEFVLTIGGMCSFIFLINCEASKISGRDMVRGKYSEETIQSYEERLVKLGFLSVHEEGYTVHMDKVKKLYVDTEPNGRTAECIDDFLESMVRHSS